MAVATEALTFLFTDIEGSTRLAHELDRDYSRVLADSRQLIRSAVEDAGGRQIELRGDELFAVFAEPQPAVDAALRAQRALAAHGWTHGEPVKVRMGLHTGRAAPEDGGYVGVDVHRAARICAAGHGGQVLVS